MYYSRIYDARAISSDLYIPGEGETAVVQTPHEFGIKYGLVTACVCVFNRSIIIAHARCMHDTITACVRIYINDDIRRERCKCNAQIV